MAAEHSRSALSILVELGACSEGVEFSSQYGRDNDRAWAECPRGDWLLWFAGKVSGQPGSPSRCRLVLCACECAKLALPFVGAANSRPQQAIEVAERWVRGEAGVTAEMVQAAGAVEGFADAAAAVVASVAAKVSFASYAAAAAAYAANATAIVPQPASYAASAAAYAADAANSGAPSSAAIAYAAQWDPRATAPGVAANARHQMRVLCGQIVHRHYPLPP